MAIKHTFFEKLSGVSGLEKTPLLQVFYVERMGMKLEIEPLGTNFATFNLATWFSLL